MKKIPLIHPIYLDVPMLVSFAAAIQGGLSFGAEITEEKTNVKSTDAKIAGKFGISNLFNSLFEASIDAGSTVSNSEQGKEFRRESKAHTEASIAILLYDHLKRNDGYIITPETADEFEKIEMGCLVEITGTLEKNPIDWMVDVIDALNILIELDQDQREAHPMQPRKGGDHRKIKSIPAAKHNPLSHMRDVLNRDRKRTPISNAILRCTQPDNLNAVVTLRTENLRDLTLSELHKNTVKIIGKVTRRIARNQKMCAFENYGMGMMKPELLREAFSTVSSVEHLISDFGDVEVNGPAIQVLPLMVFV